MLTSAFFWEFSHFFENFCILDFQTNRIKKNFNLNFGNCWLCILAWFTEFFWNFFIDALMLFIIFSKNKIYSKKWDKILAHFSEKFFFRKKSKIWMELENKIQKKFWKSRQSTLSTVSELQVWNFFYLIGPKIQNTKILQKMRKFSKKHAS